VAHYRYQVQAVAVALLLALVILVALVQAVGLILQQVVLAHQDKVTQAAPQTHPTQIHAQVAVVVQGQLESVVLPLATAVLVQTLIPIGLLQLLLVQVDIMQVAVVVVDNKSQAALVAQVVVGAERMAQIVVQLLL
jgi:hypothetical protein